MNNAATLDDAAIARLADRLQTAAATATAIAKLSDDYPAMGIADAYRVQAELRRRALARGERLVGWKAGLTSRAKMAQMGVAEPSIGFLTSAMVRAEGEPVSVSDLLHPRVECEVAFVTRRALAGPGCTAEQVLAATDHVLPAIEIIDSRFSGFSFDLVSAVADNSSSARYVGGGRARYPAELDLRSLGVVLEKNGEPVAMAAAAAVMGHPANAIAMLVNILAAQGEVLAPGSFVMSGGITEAIPVRAGDCITAKFQDLGSLSVRFVEQSGTAAKAS